MAKIMRIVRRQKTPPVTTIQLEDGMYATGYGHDWKVGEIVTAIHDARYGKNKVIKRNNTIDKLEHKD